MSFGITLGRAAGKLGALAVEGSVRAAQGAGKFGADIVEGAESGFEEKRAELLLSRAKRDAAYAEAARIRKDARENAAPMVAAPEPVVTKRGKVALG